MNFATTQLRTEIIEIIIIFLDGTKSKNPTLKLLARNIISAMHTAIDASDWNKVIKAGSLNTFTTNKYNPITPISSQKKTF